MSALRYLAALLVLLALQFVPGVSIGQAQAQSEADAIAACMARIYTTGDSDGDACRGPYGVDDTTPNTGWYGFSNSCSGLQPEESGLYPTTFSVGNCGSGSSNHSFTSRCENGVDYENGSCNPSQAECLAKPNLTGQTYMGATVVDALAFEGCEYVPSGDSVSLCLGEPGAQTCLSPTNWKPSGNAAPSGAPAPQAMPNNQACAPAPNGQTVCMKSDGQQCYQASTGRQICWRPGETGEKADADVLQTRNAGQSPVPPTTPPPSGSTFTQTSSTTSSTTVNNNSFTTTTTNYSTGGVDAVPGGEGAGEPGDGSGSSGDGGGGDGDPWDGSDLDMSEGPEAPSGEGMWIDDSGVTLDQGGFLTSRSCPAPIEVTLAGMSRTIDTSGMCDLGAVIGALVILMGLAQSAWIMGES